MGIPDERTMRLMRAVEDTMDAHNGMLGDAGTLCLFCGSGIYNGKEGIVHKNDCLIKIIRNWIRSNGGSLKL